MMKLSIAALFASTALIPAAFAQTTPVNVAEIADGEVCRELGSYVDENDTSDTGMTTERAGIVVSGADPQICRDAFLIAIGEVSTDEGAENFDAEAVARIQVAVPEPDVAVQQRAPQVSVEQAQPDVSVTPGRPVVTVNQAQPTVHVETTPPTITIDMPKPEIVVEIPNPTVDVSMAAPRVSVEQPEPTVQVTQGEVKLKLGEEVVEGQPDGQPRVSVSQENAAVRISDSAPANVEVTETQPEVRYNAAEPKVEVSETGAPRIQFNQPGEANVQIRTMSEEETREAAGLTGMADDEQSAALDETPAEDRELETAAATLGETTERPAAAMADESERPALASSTDTSDRTSVSVQDLLDKAVIGADGEAIGDVENVVARGDEMFIVMGTGGLLGIGEKQVAIPLGELTYRDEKFHSISLTEDGLDAMEEFSPDSASPFGTDQDVEVVIQ